MKVLIITPCFLPVPTTKGGAVENLVQMVLEQNEICGKCDIDVVSIWEEEAQNDASEYKKTQFVFLKRRKSVERVDKAVDQFCRIFLRKSDHSTWRVAWKLYTYGQIKQIVKETDYDRVIIENSPFYASAFRNRRIWKKYRDKLYIHVHNEYPKLYGSGKVFRHCKRILTVSEYISKATIRRTGVDKANIYKLQNCVRHTQFSVSRDEERLAQIKNQFGLKKDDIIYVFTGRLDKDKGFLEILEAMSMINNPHIKVLLIGDFFYWEKIENPYLKEIDKYVKLLKDRLIQTGYICYEEIQDYYAVSDVAILPSLWEEPGSLAVIESLTVGLPLISTYSGGIPEYALPDGAILLERDDSLVQNIREAILKLAYDPELRKKMGETNKERMRKYSEKDFYEAFLKAIDYET